MHPNSFFLLVGAAATVAILHSILPDHWVPLAIVARTQRWSLLRVARVSALAALGHVVASLVLGGILALIGLQFQQELDTQQGHIIGAILLLTGIIFLLWGLLADKYGYHHNDAEHTHSHLFGHKHTHAQTDAHNDHDHSHTHDEHEGHDHSHTHDEHDHSHTHEPVQEARQQTLTRRLAAIIIPFGIAASPDLTILPIALAASALGGPTILSVLGVFAALTIATFVGLTVLATLVGYSIKGAWLEKNANTVTSLVLIAIGIVAYIGF
jgi:nickel/cobalt transporter (NicO) family protein